jgi:glucosamine 6-phosphate synthetase-like amidotransferase/phosphosugar isomerase protein
MDPVTAAGAAFRRLEGAYALAIIFAGHPALMVGAQHGAPLAVGFANDEMFLGSDALALAPLTRRIAYLKDGDWTVLERSGARFFDAAGEPAGREVKPTQFTGASIGKGNHRHFMEKELHEHPAVIGDTLHRMGRRLPRRKTMECQGRACGQGEHRRAATPSSPSRDHSATRAACCCCLSGDPQNRPASSCPNSADST